MEGRAEGNAPEGGGAASGCRAGVAWAESGWLGEGGEEEEKRGGDGGVKGTEWNLRINMRSAVRRRLRHESPTRQSGCCRDVQWHVARARRMRERA